MPYDAYRIQGFREKIGKLPTGSAFYFVSIKTRSKLCYLKTPIPSLFRSRIVYAIKCPASAGTYIGETVRHSSTHLEEHGMNNSPANLHFQTCNQKLTSVDASIIDSISDTSTLLALEAVYIKRRKPIINTKEKFRSQTLQYVF